MSLGVCTSGVFIFRVQTVRRTQCAARGFRDKTRGKIVVTQVLEKLGTTESTTLALKREDGGKIRVASYLWETPR
jgi:hypothetical protein